MKSVLDTEKNASRFCSKKRFLSGDVNINDVSVTGAERYLDLVVLSTQVDSARTAIRTKEPSRRVGISHDAAVCTQRNDPLSH